MNIDLFKTETELSKSSIKEKVSKFKQMLDDGEIDPVDVYVSAKYFEDLAKAIRSEAEHLAVQHAFKLSKDDTVHGARVIRTSTPTTYDFQSDKEYADLYAKMKQREKDLREAAKAKANNGYYANSEGELVDPPPVKSGGKDYLRIEFKK